MKLIPVFAGAMLFFAPTGGTSARERHAPSIDWRRDLEYFAREIPRRHGAPWHATSKERLDGAVAALARRIDSLPSHAIALEFARLAAMFEDGHTEMQLFDGPNAFRRLPVILYQFGDTLRVLAALPAYRDLLGARVTHFGTVPSDDMLKRIEPFLARDNEYELHHQAPTTLASPEVLQALGATRWADSADVTLVLESGATVSRVLPGMRAPTGFETLQTARGVATAWSTFRRDRAYWFAIRPDEHFAYFRLDQSSDQNGAPSIESVSRDFFSSVDATKPDVVVIDVRLNSGGNVARNVPLIRGIETRARYRMPGALYVITGRRTFSAGTELVRDLRRVAAPIIAGEHSRGDPRVFMNREEIRLPSSEFRVDYAERWQQRDPAGDPFLPLDLSVPPTFAAYAAGRDLAIEAIAARIAAKRSP